MPFYPQFPRIARIEGDVHLPVTTDGSAVTSVGVESGQPMPAKAAQDHVQTWKFEPHDPTSFATGVFLQLVTYSCDPDVRPTTASSLSFPPRWTSVLTFEFGTAISVDRGHERLLLDDQNIAFLKGNWHVGIDPAPFQGRDSCLRRSLNSSLRRVHCLRVGRARDCRVGAVEMSRATPAPHPAHPPRD